MLFPSEVVKGRRIGALRIVTAGKYTVTLNCDCGQKFECEFKHILLETFKDCGCGENSKVYKNKGSSAWKPLISPHGRFSSPQEAAGACCLNLNTVRARCDSPDNDKWYWIGSFGERKPPARKFPRRMVHTPHGTFETMAECARHLKSTASLVKNRVNSDNYPDWYRGEKL